MAKYHYLQSILESLRKYQNQKVFEIIFVLFIRDNLGDSGMIKLISDTEDNKLLILMQRTLEV